MSLLEKIQNPADLRQFSEKELQQLATEIRETIIQTVSENGGHLAPSLGVVELTIGLHLALDSPNDKIIWDVGHQCYTHKLLTGRRDTFKSIRKFGGLSGFPKRLESEHDIADTGHASTSVSTAMGLAHARDMSKEDSAIVAVIGDGSLTGGLAYEALNQAGQQKKDLIVILNDNEMSIDANVGAISSYLDRLRLDPGFKNACEEFESKLKKIPGIGNFLYSISENIKETVKHLLVSGLLFEELGFKYVGPIDGHNIKAVEQDVKLAKQVGGPVLIHVVTKKGKGYKIAEENPDKFHGTAPFDIETGAEKKKQLIPSYTSVFGNALAELARENDKIVGITAAMCSGTGLEFLAKEFPDRFFDVGIAEQHAVTFAAGLALGGYLPVVAVYSTFLQRSYDQLIHDVALQGLHVIFALDRAGLVGEDGETHHGAFDLAYLRSIPGMTVMAPSDEEELRNMLYTSTKIKGPVAIRYPRGAGAGLPRSDFSELPVAKARIVERGGGDVAIIGVGRMLSLAKEVAAVISEKGISSTIIDARFVKPIDKETILNAAISNQAVIVMEENVTSGGFSDAVARFLLENDINVPYMSVSLPDSFIEHGVVDELFKKYGLDAAGAAVKVLEFLKARVRKYNNIATAAIRNG